MLRALPLPAFQDNYIWLLAADDGAALVVDPGEAAPVRAAVDQGLRPVAIVLTHHHADHIGGAAALAGEFGLPVFAPPEDRIALEARRVGGGDRVYVEALGLSLDVIGVPGHTRSHIAFHGAGHLFCGDTLFSLGCGRRFEGTPGELLDSLDRLAALPDATAVCCGHEYTEANGRFARVVEPVNAERDAHLARVATARARGEASLPSTIGLERACNPFLRLEAPGVQASVHAHLGRAPVDRVDAFAALRQWKDGFAG